MLQDYYRPKHLRTREWVLDKLDDLSHSFWLTGSRYFESETENSDVDFFVAVDTVNIDSTLIGLGFVKHVGGVYPDHNTVSVYRHSTGIDIQLVKHVELKLLSQRIFRMFNIRKPTTAQWNTIFRLLAPIACAPRKNDVP
jgi:hypothetical protein